MISALQIVTPASDMPITVPDAKRQLRITHSFEDAHIESLIAAATSWAQNETRRLFMTTVVRFYFDRFPARRHSVSFSGRFDNLSVMETQLARNARSAAIFLPGGRITAIESIKYIDDADTEQTLSGATSTTPGTDYQEDITNEDYVFVMPNVDEDWPSAREGRVNAVWVEYSAGFGASPSDVPDDIRMAIRFRVADLFNTRDTRDAGNRSHWFEAAENLLAPYRVQVF